MPNWVSLLKAVPWTDVISNAPAVADGARKLWKNVAAKVEGVADAPPPATAAPAGPASATVPGAEEAPWATQGQLDALALHLGQQLAAAEARNAQLQGQLAQGTELLQTLAQQNTQLAQGLASLSRRLRWATALAVLALVAAGLALGLLVR